MPITRKTFSFSEDTIEKIKKLCENEELTQEEFFTKLLSQYTPLRIPELVEARQTLVNSQRQEFTAFRLIEQQYQALKENYESDLKEKTSGINEALLLSKDKREEAEKYLEEEQKRNEELESKNKKLIEENAKVLAELKDLKNKEVDISKQYKQIVELIKANKSVKK